MTMQVRVRERGWRDVARELSQERDPARVTQLAAELIAALDLRDNGNRAGEVERLEPAGDDLVERADL